VLSDLHMGLGRSASGEWSPGEDFRWTVEFARFLEAIGEEGRNDVDLILNGDTFELVNSAAGNCGGSQNTAGCTETEAVARLDAVLKAHDADMKAIGQFARAGSNRVVFVPGDQDAALLFPRVGGRVVDALGGQTARVEIGASG
jgi:UDP-2,3-diacylglucosamine pyrophosphatase LpxH